MAYIYCGQAIICFMIAISIVMRLSEGSVRKIHVVAHLLLGVLYFSLCLHAYLESMPHDAPLQATWSQT